MLSVFLNSKKSIAVNIQIMRVFTKLREMLTDNLNLKLEIEEIKKKLNNHSKNIELVFNYLDELIEKKIPPHELKLVTRNNYLVRYYVQWRTSFCFFMSPPKLRMWLPAWFLRIRCWYIEWMKGQSCLETISGIIERASIPK